MAYIGRQPAYGAFEKQSLTADGSTTTFSLNYTVGSSSSILVSVAGVHQEPEVAYNLSGGGTSIVFTAAPADGDTVFVVFLGISYDTGELFSSGSITSQTATTESAAGDLFLTYDDSASALRKITNTNLTKTLDITGQTELSALRADDDLLLIYDTSASAIKKIQASNIAATLSYVTRNYTGNGSTTTFTVTSGTSVDDVLVMENGIVQKPTTDYTISGTTLTFQGGAPDDGVAIQIRELPR
jgi:hypothetical protein